MTSGPSTVAVLCPHPDDEAIFCGGTIRALADAGHRVVIVAATSGDNADGTPSPELRELRRRELEAAGELLGAAAVHHLGFVDSGIGPVVPPEAFVRVPVPQAAAALADILVAERAGALIADGPEGIYGHPDHIHAHHVAVRAGELAGVPTRFEMTVDREHLHFVDVHVVHTATEAVTEAWGHPSRYGHATVEIDLLVDVRAHIGAKRAAFAAHASQLPDHSEAMRLDEAAFAAVYGIEWFNRVGPPGPIDQLR
ncbi:MAG TPA: PIG-L family deacetylase [Acidimicrobiales bacterium]|nr:PIG-L family deacetylase [Acidimicrobiales bacterium]